MEIPTRKMNVRDNNKAKIGELPPRVQWAAISLEDEAWNNGLAFEILEVKRSKERQKKLYDQPYDGIDNDGDGLIDEPDEKVTWTLSSKHLTGEAMDVRAYASGVPRFYERLAVMALKYGISAPLQGAPYWDMGHFEFSNVPPKPINPSPTLARRIAERAIKRLIARGTTISLAIAKRLSQRISRSN